MITILLSKILALLMSINSKVVPGHGHKYETSEKMYGEWIDGKTIYEKTLVIPHSEITANRLIYEHGIANIDKPIDIISRMYDLSGNLYKGVVRPVSYTSDSTTMWGSLVCDVTNFSRTTITINTGGAYNPDDYAPMYIVTLLYTKTEE